MQCKAKTQILCTLVDTPARIVSNFLSLIRTIGCVGSVVGGGVRPQAKLGWGWHTRSHGHGLFQTNYFI